MKGFTRSDPWLSLCGLNCGLCSMKLGGHCGGCGFGNQSCKLARCSLAHGGVEYCFQCGSYPCVWYEHISDYDSFITHQHQLTDLEKAQRIGVDAYDREQMEKAALLKTLLEQHNDGRRKTLYCLAVNLLEVSEVREALESAETDPELTETAQRAAYLAKAFQSLAEKRGLLLKLRKKRKI